MPRHPIHKVRLRVAPAIGKAQPGQISQSWCRGRGIHDLRLILALERQRQAGIHEFWFLEASLVYRASSRTSKGTQRKTKPYQRCFRGAQWPSGVACLNMGATWKSLPHCLKNPGTLLPFFIGSPSQPPFQVNVPHFCCFLLCAPCFLPPHLYES